MTPPGTPRWRAPWACRAASRWSCDRRSAGHARGVCAVYPGYMWTYLAGVGEAGAGACSAGASKCFGCDCSGGGGTFNRCSSTPRRYGIVTLGDEKMYVNVTVWKYYMNNDFEYGEEGKFRCSELMFTCVKARPYERSDIFSP